MRNDDALALQQFATHPLGYEQVNPIALAEPIAPHIAAEQQHIRLTVDALLPAYQRLAQLPADVMIIEGAGGWRVPLNDQETLADFVRRVEANVILVVGLRLGCLNHALLTYEAIVRDGLSVAGWVVNRIDPAMQQSDHNIRTLTQWLPAPCLGVVPYITNSSLGGCIDTLASAMTTLP